jgi:hypothetical protein
VRRYEDDLEVARVAFDAVRYRVTTIGEAVESLSLEMREDHTAVPWSLLRADGRAVELAASARPESRCTSRRTRSPASHSRVGPDAIAIFGGGYAVSVLRLLP